MGEVRIEYVPLSTVERWPRNPKCHDGRAIDASIGRFGFVQPVTIDEGTGKLVAGHGRLDSLRRLKDAGGKPPDRVRVVGSEWLVPVIRGVKFASEAEAEAYLLADNRLVEVGGWDESLLAEMLHSLSVSDLDGLVGTGFSPSDLAFSEKYSAPNLDDVEFKEFTEKSVQPKASTSIRCPKCGHEFTR